VVTILSVSAIILAHSLGSDVMRPIKSFVRRAGRISNRQQHALNYLLKNYELPLSDKPWDFSEIFHREAPTIVEIGFGMGNSLTLMAKEQPQQNFIGIEVHRAGIGSLVANLWEQGIRNVRIVAHDAVEVFKHHISKDSLAGIQIFFPDPWPKKRHHKRRLIQPEFVKLVSQCLQKGGFLHCATDWQDYAQQMLAVLSDDSNLHNTTGEGFASRPKNRPLTKFEERGHKLGHGTWDLLFIKN
jgi:tRNA (guanine-N7-)-methyltransferase